ncbi:hypothetical protein DQG23_39325 [Paenibacillus contaminans]|uniref:Uncharacterized protein n=1 Tax=Paenibacillus contaminans TaxID=450362 RepID=A0A329LQT1_9BACL|nr:hypothetical protein DQG23_39325 [Paenibacillus contaminans]
MLLSLRFDYMRNGKYTVIFRKFRRFINLDGKTTAKNSEITQISVYTQNLLEFFPLIAFI